VHFAGGGLHRGGGRGRGLRVRERGRLVVLRGDAVVRVGERRQAEPVPAVRKDLQEQNVAHTPLQRAPWKDDVSRVQSGVQPQAVHAEPPQAQALPGGAGLGCRKRQRSRVNPCF
jgi:hypothetical protein